MGWTCLTLWVNIVVKIELFSPPLSRTQTFAAFDRSSLPIETLVLFTVTPLDCKHEILASKTSVRKANAPSDLLKVSNKKSVDKFLSAGHNLALYEKFFPNFELESLARV